MAQQSARRDRENQAATPCFEHATLIWTRSANSHTGPRLDGRIKRPDRWQHPTTRHGNPDVFPCPEGGVHRCCTDRLGWRWRAGWRREAAPSLTSDACRAVQGQCRLPSPHPQAAAPGDQLGRVRRRPAPAWQPDGLVHGGGDRGLARGAAHHAGWPAALLGPGDPDGADAAGRVPPGAAPDRGADRLDPPPARARSGRAGPHDPEPAGRDPAGAAAAVRQRDPCTCWWTARA